MSEELTTLSVPKEFVEYLREEVDGHNDYKRLQNWAEQETEESYNNSITLDDVDDVVREAVREEVPEVLERLKR